MTNEQICNAIRLKLTGDDGRCRVKCGTCDGEKWEKCGFCAYGFPGMLADTTDGTACNCAKNGTPGKWLRDCPNCTNGWIERPERIAVACELFSQHQVPVESSVSEDIRRAFHHEVLRDKITWDDKWREACLHHWDNRDQLPADVKQALEEFVLGKVCDCGGLDRTVFCPSSYPPHCPCNGTGRLGGYVEPAPGYRNDFEALCGVCCSQPYQWGWNPLNGGQAKAKFGGHEAISSGLLEALFRATAAACGIKLGKIER